MCLRSNKGLFSIHTISLPDKPVVTLHVWNCASFDRISVFQMISHPSVVLLILDPVASFLSHQPEVRKSRLSARSREYQYCYFYSLILGVKKDSSSVTSKLISLIFPSFPMVRLSADFTSFTSSMGGIDSIGGGMGNFKSVSTSTRVVNGKHTTTKKYIKLIRFYITIMSHF